MHQLDYVQRVRETAANAKPGEPTVVADFDDPDGFTYVHQSSFADALQVRRRCLLCSAVLWRGFTGAAVLTWMHQLFGRGSAGTQELLMCHTAL